MIIHLYNIHSRYILIKLNYVSLCQLKPYCHCSEWKKCIQEIEFNYFSRIKIEVQRSSTKSQVINILVYFIDAAFKCGSFGIAMKKKMAKYKMFPVV